jgi:hypothetical protein
MTHFVVLDDDGYVLSGGTSNVVPNGALELKEPFVLPMMPPGYRYHFDSRRPVDCRTNDRIAAEVRATRAQLLAQSDWAVLPDSPVADRLAWAAYRQALRDLTSQPGFPTDVTWPTLPGSSNSPPQVDAGS